MVPIQIPPQTGWWNKALVSSMIRTRAYIKVDGSAVKLQVLMGRRQASRRKLLLEVTLP